MLVTLLLAGCSSDRMDVPAGSWGGANVELEVTATGASARFGCGAVGRIDGALRVDGIGAFSVDGTYEPRLVLGGPRAAHYTGRIRGTSMHLAVAIGSAAPQGFDLVAGRAGSFDPCNF
jgi:hypothetical protein